MKLNRAIIGLCLCVPLAVAYFGSGSAGAAQVSFVKHDIGNFRSEACGVADFNGDGKMDVIAGPYLYLAPDWQRIKVRDIGGNVDENGKGYYHDFANLPLDVNRDGSPDLVSFGWFTQKISWFENSLGVGEGPWPQTVADENGHYEMGRLVDIDGDGKKQEVLPHPRNTVWYEVADDGGLVKHVVSEKKMPFGAGVGDVNGDGRRDLLRPTAWFEAPENLREGEWKEHPWSLGAKNGKAVHTADIHVLDVNDDGHNDVIASNAHGYGIFWYEQKLNDGNREWIQHTIDDSWSQAHSLQLADMDNDGDLDLVTGKRFYAHGGKDPGGDEPCGVYWYELRPGRQSPWKKHTITYDQGIGTSLSTPVADMDDDGDKDIVVTGKWGGPVWFENQLK